MVLFMTFAPSQLIAKYFFHPSSNDPTGNFAVNAVGIGGHDISRRTPRHTVATPADKANNAQQMLITC
jgi:hypothetical protein